MSSLRQKLTLKVFYNNIDGMQLVPDSEDIKVLSDLGLTNNQIKIYLALLKLEAPAKAIRIFQISDIARQDVYRVLLELQKIGLVEKIITKPIRYIALEPKKAVSLLMENKIQHINELNHAAEIFVSKANQRYSKTIHSIEKDRFTLITEKQSIIHKIQELIEKTQQTYYSISPRREFLSCLTILADSLYSIRNKGVEVRWITQAPDHENTEKICEILSENPQISVKWVPESVSVKFGMKDTKEIVLAVFEEGNFAETPGLWTNSPAVISLAKNYFDDCWKNGRSLKLAGRKNN